jgi:hypothetical protein
MPDPSPPPQLLLFFRASARATGSRGNMPCSLGLRRNKLSLGATSAIAMPAANWSKAPAPTPPSPRRHCKILLDIVTRIMYATSSSKIVFHASTAASARHGAMLPLPRSFIMTMWPDDVVAGGRRPNCEPETSLSGPVSIVIFIVINNDDCLRPASARLEHGTRPTVVVDRGSGPARASQHGATAISSGKLSTHS